MNKLEKYLDEVKCIYGDLKYSDFDFDDEEIFNDELFFLLENVYEIPVINNVRKRLKQQEWAENIREIFNNKCVISGDEGSYLEACHLKEVKDGEDYSEDNGILLTRNLHAQFDNHEFGINPQTYCIEIKDNVKGDILKYQGKILDLPKRFSFQQYLEGRYKCYQKK